MEMNHYPVKRRYSIALLFGLLLATRGTHCCLSTSSTSSTGTTNVQYVQCYTYQTDGSSAGKCVASSSCSGTTLYGPTTSSTCDNYASTHPASYMQCLTGSSNPAYYCRPGELSSCNSGETKGTSYTTIANCQGCTSVSSFSATTAVGIKLSTWTSATQIVVVWNATTSSNNVKVLLGSSATDTSGIVYGTYSSTSSGWNNGYLSATVPQGSYYLVYVPSATTITTLSLCSYTYSATISSCPTASGSTFGGFTVCTLSISKPTTQVIVTAVASATGTIYYSIGAFNIDTSSSFTTSTGSVTIATASFSAGTNPVYFYYYTTTQSATVYYTYVSS